jgi:hypothetical protein
VTPVAVASTPTRTPPASALGERVAAADSIENVAEPTRPPSEAAFAVRVPVGSPLADSTTSAEACSDPDAASTPSAARIPESFARSSAGTLSCTFPSPSSRRSIVPEIAASPP